MSRRIRRILVAACTVVVSLSLFPVLANAEPGDLFGPSGTEVVTPEKGSNRFGGTYDRGAGSREYTSRLGAPPDGGAGAVELRTPGDADKIQFGTGEVAGSLDQFESASYWAVRDPASRSSSLPSFQIATDVNGGDLQPREIYVLTYIPDTSSAGRWTRYDLGSARYCVRQQIGAADAYRACREGGDRRTLDDIRSEYPEMTAYAAGVNQGAGDPGLISAVDLIQVGDRTFDFEPSGPNPSYR